MFAELLSNIIAFLLYALLGAFFIKTAIENFREGRYYWFGFDIFGALVQAFYLFKYICF